MSLPPAKLPAARALRRRSLLAAAAGLAWLARTPAYAGTAARPVPRELQTLGYSSAWRLQGSGTLRYLGFRAYDAYLWSLEGQGNPLVGNQPFALEIEYAVAIRAEQMVNLSLEEMARLRQPGEDKLRKWSLEMKRSFPSVKPGDRLLGVQVPAAGTRFFVNGQLASEINDADFGSAFFAIWLDEKTQRPELRRDLLGLASSPRAAESGRG